MSQGNPLFNEKAYQKTLEGYQLRVGEEMTLQGTINKSCFLLLLCLAGGVIGWNHIGVVFAHSLLIALAAFIVAMVIIFKKTTAPLLAPVYAVLEGLALGAISAGYNHMYEGIVVQAVSITALVFALMLFLYKSGIIKVNRTFVIGVTAATGAIALFYLISLVLSLFGVQVPYFQSTSGWAIAINVIICIVAALNFAIDFQFINTMTQLPQVPKYMEWYAGFSLLVTLVWVYIEILKLLGRSRSRR